MADRGIRRLSGLFSRFLLGVVFLVVLSLPILVTYRAEGGATEQQIISQQQRKTTISLQEGLRATKIIDVVVKNDRGEEVADVDDLIISRNGKVKKVILSLGTFLGVGERLVSVPFKSLQITEKGGILCSLTKEQLDKQPKFSYREEASSEYYYPPSPIYRNLPAPYLKEKSKGKYFPWAWEYSPERLRVSAILDRTVWNNKGEELGAIDDLILTREGKVEGIILVVGGFKFLEIGEKLAAIPFRPLKATDLGLVYNITMQQLKSLPEFSYEKK